MNKKINFLLTSLQRFKQITNNKMFFNLLFKERFEFFKTTHSWPIVAALGAFMFTSDGVLYMHKFNGGWNLLIIGFISILYVMYSWWRDIIRETTCGGGFY